MADDRFDTSKDPRFKRVPAHIRRVEVDKRFAHMFKDKSFVETPKVDARGQRQRKHAGKSKLKEFYELASEEGAAKRAGAKKAASKGAAGREDSGARAAPGKRKGRRKAKAAAAAIEGDEEDEEDDVKDKDAAADDDEEAEAEEGAPDDDSEADSEEEDEEEDADEPVDSSVWEFAEPDVPHGDASRRLAIMGCDWDHVSASDLLVMLRTYLTSKEAQKGSGALRMGSVDCVRVYPSDYGLERMAKEAQAGPPVSLEDADSGEEDEGKEAKEMEALRKYQLERMKYYYAVAECDSEATASWIYDHLDGLETDGISPTMLDLRFVPDDTVFPHEPTSEATEVPKKYQGPVMQRSTIGSSKVHCTWDEAPAQRSRDLMKKRFSPKEMAEMDLKTYLASSEEEDGDEDGANALKSLVRDGDDSAASGKEGGDSDGEEEFGDMEATFNLEASKMEDDLTEKVKKMEGKVHTLKDEEKPKSTWQQYLDRRKATRKERKAKAKAERLARRQADTEPPEEGAEDGGQTEEASRGDLELMASDETDDRGFNLRQSQRAAHRGSKQQRQVDGEGSFKVDVDDPRIAGVFSSADFEIDPTNPEFRRSEGMEEVLKKKRQRKRVGGQTASAAAAAAAAQPSAGAAVAAAAAAASAAADGGAAAGGGGAGGLQLFARRGGKVAAQEAGTSTADRPGKTPAAADADEPRRPKKRKVRQAA